MKSLSDILHAARIQPELVRLIPPGDDWYLVGGALRDWLLGRTSDDFDFAMAGDPTPVARAFGARIGGHWFFLDEPRRQSRIVLRRGAECVTYDFAPFRGPDLAADLRLRDFTVNALALPLAVCRPCQDSIIDPLTGALDLQRRMLRPCSEAAFRDDPLRVLRGIRQAAVLGLTLEETTLLRMRRAAALLPDVAAERIRYEFAAIFAAPAVASSLAQLQALAVAPALFGPGQPGGEEAGGRLSRHIEETLRSIAAGDGSGLLNTLLAEELEDGFSRLALLKFAGFLMGYAGSDGVADLANRLRLSKRNVTLLRDLAKLDLQGLAALKRLPESPRARALWAETLGSGPLEGLLYLAALSRGEAELAEQIAACCAAYRQIAVAGRIPDLVDGHWLHDHLGLDKGPQIGHALQLLRHAEISGRVRSAQDARNFLISLDKKIIDRTLGGPYNLPHIERE